MENGTYRLQPLERAILKRRRSGKNQKKFYGSQKRGSKMEMGTQAIPEKYMLSKNAIIKPHELAFILRRRRGWSIPDVCKKLKLCHVTIIDMEQGRISCKRLLALYNVTIFD